VAHYHDEWNAEFVYRDIEHPLRAIARNVSRDPAREDRAQRLVEDKLRRNTAIRACDDRRTRGLVARDGKQILLRVAVSLRPTLAEAAVSLHQLVQDLFGFLC